VKLQRGTPLRVSLDFAPDRNVRVGRLALDRGTAVLEYSAEFLASRLVVNPQLGAPGSELVRAREPRAFQGLHGVFADSLPDAWGEVLLRRRAAALDIDYASLTGLDKLAWIGRRGMGALVYEPDLHEHENDDAIDLDVLARESYEVLRGRDSDVVPRLERLGGSAGGARPKVLVAMNDAGTVVAGADEIPAAFDGWLVKFRGPLDYPDVGPLEAAYAEMARAAGIDMPRTKLIRSHGGRRAYFATQRFDRAPGGVRRHVLSVAGLLDVDWRFPSLDYKGLLGIVRMVTRRQDDVEEMFRRMVFNVVALNRDDHTKQHAFMMDEAGRWRLSPAFDLTFSPGPGGEHYLTVNGEGSDVSPDAIAAVARSQSIRPSTVREVIDSVVGAAGRFRTVATRFGVGKRTASEVETALGRRLSVYSSAVTR
jgi:serine/threonine-protein kinase HipA